MSADPRQLDLWDDPEAQDLEPEEADDFEDLEEERAWEEGVRSARSRHFAEGGDQDSWDEAVERYL